MSTQKIVTARLAGKSCATIAQSLGISRETVRRRSVNAYEDQIPLYTKSEKGHKLAKVLFVNSFAAMDYDITGNPEDGILFTNSARFINTIDEIEDNELAIEGTLTVGFILDLEEANEFSGTQLPLEKLKENPDTFDYLDIEFWLNHSNFDVELDLDEEYAPSKDDLNDIQEYNWTATSSVLTVVEPTGKTYIVRSKDDNFKEFVGLAVEGKFDEIIKRLDVAKAISASYGTDTVIEGGNLYYKGLLIKNSVVKRIVDCINQGKNPIKFVNFLENLLQNPSTQAIERLFDFLNANDITINEDGTFTAFKVVTHDYKDCYTKKIDNSIGATVTMPRHLVNDNDSVTCSTGLHVCSRSYIEFFANTSDIVVECKVYPEHVVSIPVDYNDAKMRVCQYKVVGDSYV